MSDRGTPQGAMVSPLLANVYLHYAFDLWPDCWRSRADRGKVVIVRDVDGMVVLEHEVDAVRFREELAARPRKLASNWLPPSSAPRCRQGCRRLRMHRRRRLRL